MKKKLHLNRETLKQLNTGADLRVAGDGTKPTTTQTSIVDGCPTTPGCTTFSQDPCQTT